MRAHDDAACAGLRLAYANARGPGKTRIRQLLVERGCVLPPAQARIDAPDDLRTSFSPMDNTAALDMIEHEDAR